jgi:tetratricopeptide (TPR) repeat protein
MYSIVLAILVPSLTQRGAGDSEALRRIDSANRSIAQKQFQRAVDELLPAMRPEKRQGMSEQAMGAALIDLGYAYRMLGRCHDAIGPLTEAMSRWERGRILLGQARVAGINLLESYLECGQNKPAARFWTGTLAPMALKFDPLSPDLAAILAAGALAQEVRKQYADSEDLWSRAIGIWQRAPEINRDKIAGARSNRAIVRAYLGRIREAIDDAGESLAELAGRNGLEPPEWAAVLNNIAVVYIMDRRFDRAGDCLERAVAIVKRAPTRSAPEIFANYAFVLRKTGRSEEANAAQFRSNELAFERGRASAGQTVDIGEFKTLWR